MKEPLVTVIVPVYNTEKYLDRCLKSITQQTYKNIEILLINDGSSDNSGKICDNWAEKDLRIKVIHKKNAGLGMARNTGIENATGEYISFIDSDDFIDLDTYCLLVNNLKNFNADTSYCSLKKYFNDTKKIKTSSKIKEGIFTGKEILYDIIGSMPKEKSDYNREMSVCLGIFSMEIIQKNNIKFVSEREFICEDLIFDFQYLTCAKKIIVSNQEKYYYCINEDSLTHKYNSERFIKNIVLYEKVSSMIRKEFKEKSLEAILRFNRLFIGMIRSTIVQEVKSSNLSFGKKMKHLKEIVENKTIQEILKEYPYKENPIKQQIFNKFLKNKNILALYIISKIK